MPTSVSPKLLFLLLFCSFISLPLAYAEAIYQPPPVEKIKPIHKKKNFKKNRTIKNKHRTTAAPVFMAVLTIFFFVLFLGGAALFGFGFASLPMWVVGLSLMGLANLSPWIFLVAADSEKEAVQKNLGVLFPVFLILDFLAGLIFLIYGFAIVLPLLWVVGIVLLVLAVLLFVFWYFLRKDEE